MDRVLQGDVKRYKSFFVGFEIRGSDFAEFGGLSNWEAAGSTDSTNLGKTHTHTSYSQIVNVVTNSYRSYLRSYRETIE